MTLGNYTRFEAKQVDLFQFGGTAIPAADMSSISASASSLFTTSNPTPLLDLVGTPDTENPTKSYPFAKEFNESGNERSTSEEALLGSDTQGSQNQETSIDANSRITVETTLIYRNPKPSSIFNDSTKVALIKMDNSESATTGELYFLYNNIVVEHVGTLQRNSDGLMEQSLKFSCRGGTAGTAITVSDTNTYYKIRLGTDKIEEIRTA